MEVELRALDGDFELAASCTLSVLRRFRGAEGGV